MRRLIWWVPFLVVHCELVTGMRILLPSVGRFCIDDAVKPYSNTSIILSMSAPLEYQASVLRNGQSVASIRGPKRLDEWTVAVQSGNETVGVQICAEPLDRRKLHNPECFLTYERRDRRIHAVAASSDQAKEALEVVLTLTRKAEALVADLHDLVDTEGARFRHARQMQYRILGLSSATAVLIVAIAAWNSNEISRSFRKRRF